MKKLFSGVFGAMGAILMVFTIVLSLFSLNASPKILDFPQDATQLIQNFTAAVNQGDLTAAGGFLYGQPELTAGDDWSDNSTLQLWDAYVSSLACTPTQEPKAQDDGITWVIQIESMNVAAALAAWQQETNTLVAALEEPGDQDVADAMAQGLSQALAQATTQTRELTLKLIRREEQWWIDPDSALMQVLSGQA